MANYVQEYAIRDDKVYDTLSVLTGIANAEIDNKMYMCFDLETVSGKKNKIHAALSASNAWFFGCLNMGKNRAITDDTILFPIKSIDDFRYYMVAFCGFDAPTIDKFIDVVLSTENVFPARMEIGREILKKSKED